MQSTKREIKSKKMRSLLFNIICVVLCFNTEKVQPSQGTITISNHDVRSIYNDFYFLSLSVIPSSYYYFPEMASVNGASATGHCSNVIKSGGMTRCLQPDSSVLFDNHIPALNKSEIISNPNTWASQFLTILQRISTKRIIFDFTYTPDFVGVERVEIVLFNCPKLGISATSVVIRDQMQNSYTASSILVTPCDSLVGVCLPCNISSRTIILDFSNNGNNWLHLAEVTFYRSNDPPWTIINDYPFPPSRPPQTTSTGSQPTTDVLTTSSKIC